MPSPLQPASPASPARRAGDGYAVAGLTAVAVLLPIGFVLASLFQGVADAQSHIWATRGMRYLAGTLTLSALVAIGAGGMGGVAALLVSLTEFPGRRILSVLLVLPFAAPAYITAYAYADLLGPFGLVAGALAAVTGDPIAAPPSVRSLGGAAFVLSLSTYVYVYLALRAALQTQSGALLEAARSLGASPGGALARVVVPACRAALAGGLALALMETAADFGVADYYGVETLSVGIFRTWYGLGDLAAASQIAAGLFLIALLLLLAEQGARRGARAESTRIQRRSARVKLHGWRGGAASLVCAAPVALGFVLPAGVLLAKLSYADDRWSLLASEGALLNTAAIAVVTALAAGLCALLLAAAVRRSKSALVGAAARVSTLGYALPGAVVAIGVVAVAAMLRSGTGIVVGGFLLLAYALTVRFMTAAYNATSAGLDQIHPLTDDAARTLGAKGPELLRRVYAPLTLPALSAGVVIVLIDTAKELPATLLLRPFNFETLATQVYRLASDERLADAAPAALLLIAVSLIPALWLNAVAARADRQANALIA